MYEFKGPWCPRDSGVPSGVRLAYRCQATHSCGLMAGNPKRCLCLVFRLANIAKKVLLPYSPDQGNAIIDDNVKFGQGRADERQGDLVPILIEAS